MEINNTQNVIGIKIESKEHYDKLMENHSVSGKIFGGIDFKGLFNGYPEGYPCLVEFYIGNDSPFDFMYANQMRKIMDDGYLIQVYKEQG